MSKYSLRRLWSHKLGWISALGVFSVALTAVLGFASLSQALEMQVSGQGQVLDATTYPPLTLTSVTNTSLLLKVTPLSFDGANWTYQISWNRTRSAVGSVYVTLKSNKSIQLFSSSNAPQVGSATFTVAPSTAGRVEFYSSPSAGGTLLLRKFFTSLPSNITSLNGSASTAARIGFVINKNGTIYLVGPNGLYGFTDAATFTAWGYTFSQIQTPNIGELALSVLGNVPTKNASCTSPLAQIGGTCAAAFNGTVPATNTPISNYNPTVVTTADNTCSYVEYKPGDPRYTGGVSTYPDPTDPTGKRTITIPATNGQWQTPSGGACQYFGYLPYGQYLPVNDTNFCKDALALVIKAYQSKFGVTQTIMTLPNAVFLDQTGVPYSAGCNFEQQGMMGSDYKMSDGTVLSAFGTGGSSNNNVAFYAEDWAGPYGSSIVAGGPAGNDIFARASVSDYGVKRNNNPQYPIHIRVHTGLGGKSATLYLMREVNGGAQVKGTIGTVTLTGDGLLNSGDLSVGNLPDPGVYNVAYFMRAVMDNGTFQDSNFFNIVDVSTACPANLVSALTLGIQPNTDNSNLCLGKTAADTAASGVFGSSFSSLSSSGFVALNTIVGGHKFTYTPQYGTTQTDAQAAANMQDNIDLANGVGIYPDGSVKNSGKSHIDFYVPANAGMNGGYELDLVRADDPCKAFSYASLQEDCTLVGDQFVTRGGSHPYTNLNATISLDKGCQGIPGAYCHGTADFTIPSDSSLYHHYYFIDLVELPPTKDVGYTLSKGPFDIPFFYYIINSNETVGIVRGTVGPGKAVRGGFYLLDPSLTNDKVPANGYNSSSSCGDSGVCYVEPACTDITPVNLPVNNDGNGKSTSVPVRKCYNSTIQSVTVLPETPAPAPHAGGDPNMHHVQVIYTPGIDVNKLFLVVGIYRPGEDNSNAYFTVPPDQRSANYSYNEGSILGGKLSSGSQPAWDVPSTCPGVTGNCMTFSFNMDTLVYGADTTRAYGGHVLSNNAYFALMITCTRALNGSQSICADPQYSSADVPAALQWLSAYNNPTGGYHPGSTGGAGTTPTAAVGVCGTADGTIDASGNSIAGKEFSTAPVVTDSTLCQSGSVATNIKQDTSGKLQWTWTCHGTTSDSAICQSAYPARGGSPVVVCMPTGQKSNGCSSTYKYCQVNNVGWDNTCNATSSSGYSYNANCLAGDIDGPAAGKCTAPTNGGTAGGLINGACGTADGATVGGGKVYTAAPLSSDASLCAGGSPSGITGVANGRQWQWTCAGTGGGTNSRICQSTYPANGGSPVVACTQSSGCSSTYLHCKVNGVAWDNACNVSNSTGYSYDATCLAGSIEGNVAGGKCPSGSNGGNTATLTFTKNGVNIPLTGAVFASGDHYDIKVTGSTAGKTLVITAFGPASYPIGADGTVEITGSFGAGSIISWIETFTIDGQPVNVNGSTTNTVSFQAPSF